MPAHCRSSRPSTDAFVFRSVHRTAGGAGRSVALAALFLICHRGWAVTPIPAFLLQRAAEPIMSDPRQRASEAQTLLAYLIAAARKAGAESADAIYHESRSLSAGVRLGQPEDVESSESRDLGLRAIGRAHV